MAAKDPEKRIFTVPNALSALRLALLPVFVWLYFRADSRVGLYAAAAVMAFSMITDALDGFIARRFNLVTTLGKALDPVADKLTQAVLIVCLAIKLRHRGQLIIVACIFVVKELFMLVMGVLNLTKGRMLNGALIAGKVCTTLLFVGFALLLLFPDMPGYLMWIITAVCSAAMLVSLGFYASTYMGGRHGVEVVDIKNASAG